MANEGRRSDEIAKTVLVVSIDCSSDVVVGGFCFVVDFSSSFFFSPSVFAFSRSFHHNERIAGGGRICAQHSSRLQLESTGLTSVQSYSFQADPITFSLTVTKDR